MTYRVFLAREVVETLRKLPLRQRQELTKFIVSLEDSPFQQGDYTERDDVDRRIEISILSRYALCYWADHAVKEVKVVDLRPAGS
jgi:mRNA-degrading endonuclease RelE of RelBE toxin-antitoxin system